MQHGWNATVYRALDADLEHWVSKEGDALVGFTRQAGTRVVAGAPVACRERLAQVAREFEDDAANRGERVCYVCAEERLLGAAPGRYAVVRIGAQPVWDARRWAAVFDSQPGLRAQRNRALNKGVRVERWDTMLVATHPGIAACRSEWLAQKRLPRLAFLAYVDFTMAPATALLDRRLFVATRDGRVTAYLVTSPIPGRAGWLVEQVVRSPDAVNGTVEVLIDETVRSLAADGASLVTLGLAPLAGPQATPPEAPLAGSQAGSLAAPLTGEHHTGGRPARGGLLGSVRASGSHFYDFAGLEGFKRKFKPERWESVYLLSREARTSARTLYAVGAAFCGGHPARTLVGGLLRTVA